MSRTHYHLRRHVVRRPAESVRLLALNHLGQAKVDNLDISRVIQNQVLQREVAVRHLPLVHVRERLRDRRGVECLPVFLETILGLQ